MSQGNNDKPVVHTSLPKEETTEEEPEEIDNNEEPTEKEEKEAVINDFTPLHI